jgi:hypothetical protein
VAAPSLAKLAQFPLAQRFIFRSVLEQCGSVGSRLVADRCVASACWHVVEVWSTWIHFTANHSLGRKRSRLPSHFLRTSVQGRAFEYCHLYTGSERWPYVLLVRRSCERHDRVGVTSERAGYGKTGPRYSDVDICGRASGIRGGRFTARSRFPFAARVGSPSSVAPPGIGRAAPRTRSPCACASASSRTPGRGSATCGSGSCCAGRLAGQSEAYGGCTASRDCSCGCGSGAQAHLPAARPRPGRQGPGNGGAWTSCMMPSRTGGRSAC